MANEVVTNQQLPGLILALEGLAVALSFSDAHDSRLVERAIYGLNELKQHRSAEPIAWINEDELPKSYPYDAMFPLSKVDIVRMFPVFGPQSTELVVDFISSALSDVAAERQRQQSVKGYSVEQDDTYIGGELAAAAISYIEPMEAESYWPADWHDDSFKPSDYRRNLVKAGALILAEIERIDRQEKGCENVPGAHQ